MTPQPLEPRTAAGRALLDDLAYTRDNYLDPILAIEAEAANGSGLDVGRLAEVLDGRFDVTDYRHDPHGFVIVDPWRAASEIADEYARLTGSPDPKP